MLCQETGCHIGPQAAGAVSDDFAVRRHLRDPLPQFIDRNVDGAGDKTRRTFVPAAYIKDAGGVRIQTGHLILLHLSDDP